MNLGKHLKLNIKNLQLAGALKQKKADTEETLAPKSTDVLKKKKTRILQSLPDEEAPLSEKGAIPAQTTLPKEPVSQEIPIQEEPQETPLPETIAKEPPAAPLVEEKKPSVTPPPPSPATPVAEKTERETTHAPSASFPKPLPPRKEPPKELRPKKKEELRSFDSRDRQGLRDIDNEAWRKRRAFKPRGFKRTEEIIRPKSLQVRLPITIKDLAQAMKLKSSELISKLLMQGLTLTLNDYLTDETVVQLLGHDFDCQIQIDTTEEKRIRITDETIRQEIGSVSAEKLSLRPPVVAFMGHVDHGKTSLIDSIRKSNRVAGEAGAITQHIGAFQVQTKAGKVTILDTPGHEAFSEMRSRGANVTDIVILVIAGDEGMKAQTDEAMRQAKEANVPILVAINKCDKQTFDPQKVYRELADRELLPEAWGGTIITVNCSAVTGAGISELLEMIALQAEILELRASPSSRARGTILESEMHKGLGAVATVLVQNGTLRKGDAIVFGHFSGRVKTMQDEQGKNVDEAPPSSAVRITGLSELALAGSEFIVVKNEKEARDLAEAREAGYRRDG
ncbi:MAG: translation initiation factor IF-2, partial [Chlamydiia bacterium]|nr:translation initiation factor IF-2 [Chlamydiia bacterium]